MRARRAGMEQLHRLCRASALVGLALAVAACGLVGSDNEEGESAAPRAKDRLRVPQEIDADEGCGQAAHTEPGDMSAGRTVARCATGYPKAQPLPQPTTLKVGIRRRTEDIAPLLLADHFDEFAAEGLTVELVEFDNPTDLFAAVENGLVDVAAGQMDAAFFDETSNGGTAKLALGGPIAAAPYDVDTPQAGFWMRTDLLDKVENAYWIELEDYDNGIAVEDSIGDAVSYPIDFVLQQHDMSINSLNLQVDSGKSAVDRMLSGELIGAWVDDPYWQELAARDNWQDGWNIQLVATMPASESLGGMVLSQRLIDPNSPDRAVGLAFSRAVIRTINTYLAGDYQDDEDVVAALAEETGLDEEDIVATPAWVFDWEVRENTTKRIQDAFLNLGGVVYENVLDEGQLVDRSLYEEATAQQ
jgi:NitT/TauT family transport system substrate-binding protein